MLKTKNGLNFNRIEWIDALKGFCIILVVYCHGVILPEDSVVGNILMTLAWGAVPCFMMASGALMHQAKKFEWPKYFKKLGMTYVILVCWRVIYFIVYTVFGKARIGISKFINYAVLLNDVDEIDTGLMWYMIAYLFILVIYPVTYFLFSNITHGRKVLLFLLIFSGVSGIIIPSINWLLSSCGVCVDFSSISSVISIGSYTNMLFYFLLGAFWYEYREYLIEKIAIYKIRLYIVSIIVGIIGLTLVKWVDSGLLTWGSTYVGFGYARTSTIFLATGIFGVFSLDNGTKIGNTLAMMVGKNTMGIFYMHYILLSFLSWLQMYQNISNNYFFGMNLIKTVVVTLICTVITVVTKKIPIVKRMV